MTTGIKVLITAVVVVAGILALAFSASTSADTQYYKHVDELMTDPARWTKEPVIQVHGFARQVPLRGELRDGKLVREFELEKNGRVIRVHHEGVVPDNFKDNSETVVKGRLRATGEGGLELITVGGEQGIMAKCPSKYDGNR